MGCSASTVSEINQLHYYIDMESHRVLFNEDDSWHTGLIRENKQKKYLIMFDNEDGKMNYLWLPKKRARFVSAAVWNYYKDATSPETFHVYLESPQYAY